MRCPIEAMRSIQNNNEVRLITVRQAAERLCCSAANVYALIEEGAIAIVQVGKRKGYRIDLRDLETFVSDRKYRYAVPRPTQSHGRLKHLKS